MHPFHSQPGQFWAIRYIEAGKGFKFSPVNTGWGSEFTDLGNGKGFTVSDGNCSVATSGLYTLQVDYANGKVIVEPAVIVGMAEPFGNGDWNKDLESARFTINGNLASFTTVAAGEQIRTCVVCELSGDWWHAEFIRQFNPNVHVLYNGYDPKQFYPEDIPTNQFTISYIGSLFEWQKPALEIVKQAIHELNNHEIELNIHTPKENPIAHDQLGDAIRRSSIMLVLTSPDTHGMLTTKFYEALGCEKPILCVPSDHGALAELIEYTHAGIATDDKEAIKTFIIEKYNEWKKQSFTRETTTHKDEFSREYQYDQFYSTYIQC